jgi:hypothetical protein
MRFAAVHESAIGTLRLLAARVGGLKLRRL